jgi:hypothetical protein
LSRVRFSTLFVSRPPNARESRSVLLFERWWVDSLHIHDEEAFPVLEINDLL